MQERLPDLQPAAFLWEQIAFPSASITVLPHFDNGDNWYHDPANHMEAVGIVAKFTKLPPERVDWAFTKRDDHRDPDGIVDLAALQRNIDAVYKLGFIKAELDVSKYADLIFVKEAAARNK